MKVKIKKLHSDAVIPKYAKVGDSGMDIVAMSKEYDEHGNVVYGTGLAFEIPENHFGLLCPRSSLSKYCLRLSNNLGILDSSYRGEVLFKFKPSGGSIVDESSSGQYNIGDRIGQIIILPYPQIEFEVVEELSETERGQGGFGSSGR